MSENKELAKSNVSQPTTNGMENADVEKSGQDDTESTEEMKSEKPTMQVVLTLNAIFVVVFLVSLDRTIIATAIPQITNDFHSLNDVGWYGSAYLLTACALQLAFGKIYTLWPTKWVLMISVVIFEIASAICGAAPNSIAFILGRAIAGVGVAGIFAGVIVTLTALVPLEKRPKLQGLMGMFMVCGTITGPLIGGAFTTHSTWRWCFYINLPIGGLALVVIYFFMQLEVEETTKQPWTSKLKQLDGPGLLFSIPGIVCLILALQWGGQTYAWSDGRVIALLVVGGVLLLAFAATQVLLPHTATLPPRLFNSRTIFAALWNTLFVNCSNFIFIYFLPIWFQAITGVTAVESGIRTLPIVIATVVGQLSGGISTVRIGYYVQWAIAGTCLMSIGSGLLTTLQVGTSEGKWIGYQIIYGLGFGWTFQVPNLAMMCALAKEDLAIGFALNLFVSLLGSTIFVSVGENVLSSQLIKRLSGFSGFDPSSVTAGGATSILDTLPAREHAAGLVAYNEALRRVFIVGLISACLSVLGAVSLPWLSFKKFKADQLADAKAERAAKLAKAQKQEEESS